MARTCPRDGCTNRIPSEMFACKSHWFSLPADVRRDIWRAYRAWEGEAGTLEQLEAQQARALAHWGQT